ncbi:MAG TPA: protein-L-isoaspartate(D-aspartate) O-methyltransferase [Bacteroidales bacterium]|nr:protein-L-isoaspartate(D-aspartate) O-methyltransferase [Bacteroidales bacterium]
MNICFGIIALICIEMNPMQVDKYASLRDKMVSTQIEERGISNPFVLKAMRKVPRHLFVSPEYGDDAYGDYPLPISHGQTISQPYIVAYMTEIVNPSRNKKVLEIGTGSGYQAAVLAEIVDSVFTIELVDELATEAKSTLKRLGYRNISVRSGDGYNGWPEQAPFDIIIVTAAAPSIPEPLIAQLAEGGRLVIPVGASGGLQELKLVTKKRGKVYTEKLIYVRFVPFKRKND